MPNWLRISLLLCGFGFLKEIRPSEPFVTDYLIEPWRNFTINEINKYVYPIGTYSYAAQLVIVFLITDLLRYKPLIILTGLSGVIIWSMLIWTKSMISLQILEIFYGTYLATEVAYYTYIYAKVDRNYYLTVTAHTRSAQLCGRFIAGSLAQILFYFQLMDLKQLNYITLSAQCVSLIWACSLPPVATSIYFHSKSDEQSDQENPLKVLEFGQQMVWWKRVSIKLQTQLTEAYSNRTVVRWSIWYAMGMCAYLQIISYIQILWINIDNSHQNIWNGAVEACITIAGAAVTFLPTILRIGSRTERTIFGILILLTIMKSGAIFLATETSSRLVSYAGYMIFSVLYSFTITVASAEIAKHLKSDSFGLIFGINTLMALLLQTLLTIICVSDSFGWTLNIFKQFEIYATYFIILAAIFTLLIGWDAVMERGKVIDDQDDY